MFRQRFMAVAVAALTLPPGAASAQMDLSGDWPQRMHEAQPGRGPGPELGGAETTYPEYQATLRTLPKPTKPAAK